MAVSHEGVLRASCIGSTQITCNQEYIACPISKTTVGVWSRQDLSNQPLELSGHTKVVMCLCFGKRQKKQLLCSASEDHIHIWNVTKGYRNHTLGCHAKPLCVGKDLGTVQHISFNSCDALISVCIEKDVWILNIQTCKLDSVLEGHIGQVTQADFCPWNEFLIVSIAEDRTFKIWDIQNSCLVYQSAVVSGFPFVSLAYDETQHCMAVGSTDGKVRMYDLKEDTGYRCLHEMDVGQRLLKLTESTSTSGHSEQTGPSVISSRPKWKNPSHQDRDALENDEYNVDQAEAGLSILGLFFVTMPGQTADDTNMVKLPFLNNPTQVKDIFHMQSVLVVGLTTSIVLVNCNTWDILHCVDFKEPLVSRNELDPVQYTLPTAGLYAFTQINQQKPLVQCLVTSLFHNAVHVVNIEIPTNKQNKETTEGISSRLSQSVGCDTHGVCSTDVIRDQQPCIGAAAAESYDDIITVLSSTPLCANSPLKAELTPKSQSAATPANKSSKKATKGRIQDQPLTFKSKVKSSGYTSVPRSTMFSPKTSTNNKKPSVSLKKTSTSSGPALLKEYPMNSEPPTLIKDKVSLTGQPTAINCITYSNSGRHIACALANKSAHILHLPVGSTTKETVLTGHDGSVSNVHFSHDDKWLLTSSTDKTVRLWSPKLSDPLLIFNTTKNNFGTDTKGKDKDNPPFPREISQSSFYYMDKFVLISCGNGLYLYKYYIDPTKDDIKRYQSNSKYKLVKLFTQERAQNITCFSCVNSFYSYIVFCCGSNKSIEVFDMNVGRSVRVIMDAHTRPVHVICQNQGSVYTSHSSESYDLFLTAAVTDGIRLWDLRTNRCVRRYEGHVCRSHPVGMAISPCSRYIATGSEDRSVYIYDVRGTSFCHRLTGHSDVVADVAFHPAKSELAAASSDGKIKFYSEEA